MTRFYDALKIRLLRPKVVPRDTEVTIISYPKSGRTWLRVLIGKAICLKYGLPDDLMLDSYKLTAAAGLLRAQFTHDYSEIVTGIPYDALPTQRSEYAGKKVIFIARDVKDVLVSSYFQATKRTGKFDGSISSFIRTDRFGVKKVVTFYNIWHNNRHVPDEFILLSYEEMHRNPADALIKTLCVLGADGIDRATVEQAVEFARFDHMKKMEMDGTFDDPKMRPGDANDKESFKVRKGKVGGYREYLGEEDIRFIDQTVEELGCPFVSAMTCSTWMR
jgi:hypothetical protein